MLLFFGLYIGSVQGQEPHTLQFEEDGPFFNHLPAAEHLDFQVGESAEISFKIEGLGNRSKQMALFFSDAELQSIKINGKKYFAGKYQNTKLLSNKWDYRHFIIPVRDLKNQELIFEASNITKRNFTLAPKVFSSTRLENGIVEIIGSSKLGLFFTIFFLGGIFIFLSYIVGLFIQTKNDDFKYYAYYLGAILLHNLIQADAFLKIYFLFPKNPIWYHNLNEFVQMFIYAFFMLFLKIFLEIPKESPKLNSFVNKSIVATILFAFIFLGAAVLTKNFHFLQNYLSILWLVVATMGGIIVVSVYRKSKSPIRYYIMLGSVFLLIGSILELWSSLNIAGGYNWNMYAVPDNSWYPFNYTQLAILLETVCFALGIGYKIRKNEKLLRSFKQKEIEDLKNREINKELENRLLDMELSSLRSQMNPHFLFNSLNSVNDYIMHENPETASKYLTKFAQLMRVILNNSKKKLIPLNDELKALQLYIDLEKLRFDKKFDYVINKYNVDGFDIYIPTMLIQPYVENAIKHGLMSLERGGMLRIDVNRSENRLIIAIHDNGIGREASLKKKLSLSKKRNSHGMKITSERLKLLNKIYGINAEVLIEDKIIKGIPKGTSVFLNIEFNSELIYDEIKDISHHY